MAVAYSINGGSEIPGIVSKWERIPKRQNADGTIDFADYALNIWTAELMTDTAYESLQTALGTALTSLETNDIDARNSSATYTTVLLDRLAGQQQGRRMVGVEAVFKVNP